MCSSVLIYWHIYIYVYIIYICIYVVAYIFHIYVCVWVSDSHSVMSNSLRPHGLYSLPGSPIHGILQARTLECVAISLSNINVYTAIIMIWKCQHLTAFDFKNVSFKSADSFISMVLKLPMVVIQVSQHYLLKRLPFFHCIFLPPLSIN